MRIVKEEILIRQRRRRVAHSVNRISAQALVEDSVYTLIVIEGGVVLVLLTQPVSTAYSQKYPHKRISKSILLAVSNFDPFTTLVSSLCEP